jgi:hypothetical protein
MLTSASEKLTASIIRTIDTMKAIRFSETTVNFGQTTICKIPEDRYLHTIDTPRTACCGARSWSVAYMCEFWCSSVLRELLIEVSCKYLTFQSFTFLSFPGWNIRPTFGVSVIIHIQTHGRTPLDEWSARRRYLYLHRTTQHINTSDKHTWLSGIRSRDPSNRAAAVDLRLRPRDHWDRQLTFVCNKTQFWIEPSLKSTDVLQYVLRRIKCLAL